MRAATSLALLAALVATPAAGQVLRGELTDEASGAGVGGAAVSLLDPGGNDRATAVTDAEGSFTVRAPADGVYRLRLTRAGYRPVESRPFTLSRGDTIHVPLTTRADVTTLEGVTGRARGSSSRNFAGFLDRERKGFGRYFGPEVVKRRNFGPTGSFLMGMVSGLDHRGQNVFLRNRGRYCAPMILLDGFRFVGAIDEIPSSEVRAVEVYDQPAQIPPELSLTPFNSCGAIAIWTAYGLGVD